MSKATDELLAKAGAILEAGENEELSAGVEALKELGEEATGNAQEYKDLKKLVESLSKPDAPKAPEAPVLHKCVVRSLDKEEKDMVFGINGKIVQVKLGEEVELSKDQILAIKGAEMIKYEAETDKDGTLTGKNRAYKEPRYIVEVVI